MDILVEHKSYDSYQRVFSEEKTCRLNSDAVIPDTFEDISKLLTVSISTKIVSKDLSYGKLIISAEASATMLFIPENSAAPESVVTVIPFTAEFNTDDIPNPAEAVASIRLIASDWRELNPRKVGINADISVVVDVYLKTEMNVPAMAPDTEEKTYFKSEQKTIKNISLVTEKLATVEAEHELPDASSILTSASEYYFDNAELVGSRLIVKGHTHSRLILRKSDDSLGAAEYDTAFSQLFDYIEGDMPDCEVNILPAGEYYELHDNMVSMQLRIVLELICYENRVVDYISDAYACNCDYSILNDDTEVATEREALSRTHNTILTYDLPEGCGNAIVTSANTGRINTAGNTVSVPVSINAISCGEDNEKLPFKLRGDVEFENISCENLSAQIDSVNCAVIGGTAQLEIAVTLNGSCVANERISAISAISINTEATKKLAPSLYIVRARDNDIWTIAKRFGADRNRIMELNDIEEKCEAYILDKAEIFGADIDSVSVSASWSMDGYWYPDGAEIIANCTEEQKRSLSSALEGELGIAKERQVWTNG